MCVCVCVCVCVKLPLVLYSDVHHPIHSISFI